MSPVEPEKSKVKLLYQERPRNKSRFPRSRSKTESRESYHADALHEYGRLKVNGTIPNHIIQVNYKIELSKEEIQALWTKHSRRLRNAGIVARVAVEITKDEWRQRPINKVHYHFVAKDDRTKDEMEAIFETLYESAMPRSAFKVHVLPFDEEQGGWEHYIEYFLKLWEDDNILLEKGGLRRYYTINEAKWWTYSDGTPRSIRSIDKAIQEYAIAKKHLKKSERFFEINAHQPVVKSEPTNCAKLIATLAKETDETLYDWFAILMGKKTVFGTKPPKWLLNDIHGSPQKCLDLLGALYIVLEDTDNPLIVFAFEIYYNHKIEQKPPLTTEQSL